ncbi:Protein CBG01244 [Caenorhabditis briggsae]|uniref:Protein CBG01244 n=1 Tax=Caenorhabditis briggsae TaxID=6238 RepID=A8WPX8_CAEBR|nr:Protein CBG01244 [Caenorhabditis briggsae]CAP22536.2 Protein CBG01244 [Caenorhabditis briggsae]
MPPALHISGLCQICDQPAFGHHFGVLSCRACAAFFRRAVSWTRKPSCLEKKCPVFGKNMCKICRLKKCLTVGMDVTKFQKNRDPISNSYCERSKIATPQSLANFLGRPESILCFEPDRASSTKTVIDVSYLLEKATHIFQQDPSYLGPYEMKSSLERVTYAMDAMKSKKMNHPLSLSEVIGKTETFLFYEYTFLEAAHWLAEFPELQQLNVEMDILKSAWTIWMRLDALAETAEYNRLNGRLDNGIQICTRGAKLKIEEIKMDLRWCTNYSAEQIESFMNREFGLKWNRIIDEVMICNPTSFELNYMLLQLCLHNAGKKHQGNVLEATESLLGILADNLHAYYSNKIRKTNYSGRIAQMMKINRMIEVELRDRIEKNSLANVFDLYKVEYSHPEMFDLV